MATDSQLQMDMKKLFQELVVHLQLFFTGITDADGTLSDFQNEKERISKL